MNSLLFILIFITPTLWSYGFDSATSCSQKSSRHGRAQLLASIPCDLTQQAYCNLPGSQYPWHAVRRFVHENQGLMKRMYGDVRHISVLRTEIHNNDIEIEDFESTAARYSRNNNFHRRTKYLQSEFQNSKNNDVLNEPYFRPTTSTISANRVEENKATNNPELIVSSTTTTVSSLSSSSTPSLSIETESPLSSSDNGNNNNENNLISSQIHSQKTDDVKKNIKQRIDQNDFVDSSDNNLESTNNNNNNSNNSNNIRQNNEMSNIQIVQSPNLSILNKTESATISTTLKVVQQIIQSEIESEKIAEKQHQTFLHEKAEIIQKNSNNDNKISNKNNKNNQNSIENTIEQNTEKTQNNLKNQTQFNEIIKEKTNSIVPESINNNNNNNKQQQQQHEAFIEKKKINKPNTIEGQLFQDTVQKETPAILNLRGINACPVKEEVVAPFWANNTRGEVLALLNLYPFEQYVHWEKCTHENKQMYCRDGCRCEQQYRLHRLLAYDPHNECRGIFSDWFRFPSCCICKCYDIPLEFRATSRSPRTSLNDNNYNNDEIDNNYDNDDNKIKHRRHPIDVAEDELQRAVYEHATEDWYRQRENFDYLDD